MSHPALLDVNVLVALFDPDHVHHELAHDWFADSRADGWASCPVTENGFVRVVSNPAYGSPIARPADVTARLRKFCQSSGHQFWPDTLSLRDRTVFDLSVLGNHRHLTDVYLLGLATQRGARLATLDRSIPWKAVVGATPANLTVIAPVAS